MSPGNLTESLYDKSFSDSRNIRTKILHQVLDKQILSVAYIGYLFVKILYDCGEWDEVY